MPRSLIIFCSRGLIFLFTQTNLPPLSKSLSNLPESMPVIAPASFNAASSGLIISRGTAYALDVFRVVAIIVPFLSTISALAKSLDVFATFVLLVAGFTTVASAALSATIKKHSNIQLKTSTRRDFNIWTLCRSFSS